MRLNAARTAAAAATAAQAVRHQEEQQLAPARAWLARRALLAWWELCVGDVRAHEFQVGQASEAPGQRSRGVLLRCRRPWATRSS